MDTGKLAGVSRRRKLLAALAAFAVSSTVLVGGSLAVLTDRDGAETQSLVAGTVDIDVENNVMPNFNVPIEPMAAGDSFARYVNVRNKGNLATRPLSLSQVNGAGLLIQGDYGVLVNVDACDEAWSGGVCGGEEYGQALPPVQVRGWNGLTPLTMPGLKPGETMYFKFTTAVPEAAPNEYQTEASWIEYTFNGVQRGAIKHDGQNTPVEEPQLSGEPTMTANVIGARQVELSWLPTQGALTYRAERAQTPDGPWTLVSIGQDRRLIDASVEAASTYYYRAVAYGDTAATKLASPAVKVSTWMVAATPKISVSASYSTLSTTASWSEIKGAQRYRVYRGSTSDFNSAELVLETTDSTENQVETSAEEATAYYYWLQASDDNSSYLSDAKKVVVPLRTIVLRANPSPTSAALSWTAVPGASYKLMKGSTVVYQGSETTFQVEDLEQDKIYVYTLETVYRDAKKTSELRFSALNPTDTYQGNVNSKVNLTYSVTPTSIEFNWNALPDATSYMLLESDTNTFPTPEELSSQRRAPLYSGTAASHTQNMAQYTKSYYRLYVYTARGIFAANSVSITTLPEASELTLAPSSPAGTIAATWTASELAEVTYELQLFKNGSWITVADSTSTSYNLSNLDPGTYLLRVATVTATGERSYSSQQSATLDDLGGLTEPIVTVVAEPQGLVRVNWDSVDNAVSYQVDSRRKGETAWTRRVNTTNLTGSFSGGNGQELEVRVAAIAGSSKQVYSPTHSLISTLILPSASVSTSFVAEGLRVSASMAANDKIVSYFYLLSSDASMAGASEFYTSSSLQPAVVSLPPDAGKLYVQVKARDFAGRELALAPITLAYTPPAAPFSAAAVLASGSTYTVTWAPSSTATRYEIRNGNTVLLSTAATSASLTLTGGQEYTGLKAYAIRAYARESATDIETSSLTGASLYANPNVAAPTIAVAATDVPSVTLSWSGASNATQYVLERSATADMASPSIVYTGSSPSFKDTTLPKNTVQYYRVKVTAANGSVAQSNVISASTVLESMDASAEILSTSRVKLSWAAVSGATKYQVYVSGANGSVLNAYGSPITALNLTVTGLASGTDHQLRVLALDANNKSIAGSEVFKVTTPMTTPTITKGASNWSNKTVSINFSSEENRPRYLETSQDGGQTWTLTGPAPSYTSNIVCEPGSTCLVRGYLTNANGVKQPYSNTLTVELQPGAPSSPSLADLSTSDSASLRLTWVASAGADSYNIYRRSGSGSYAVVGTSSATTYTDSTVAYATTYDYAVAAVSAAGVEGPTSSANSRSVKARPPVLAPITSVGPNAVTLTWDQTSATPVRILRDGVPIAQLSTAVTSYTDTGVRAGATYEYYVDVTFTTAFAAQSNMQSVTTPIASPEVLSSSSSSSTPTSLTVNWSAVNAKSILAQYSTTPDFATVIGAQTLAGTASSYTFTGLAAGTEYHVRLLTEWAETSSTVSRVYTTGTSTAAPNPTASSTTTDGVAGASLSIQWPAVDRAVDYVVEWDTVSTFNSAQYGSVTTTELAYAMGEVLPNDRLYYYRVSARTTYRTATSTVKTIATAPAQATIASITDVTDFSAKVNIDWVTMPRDPLLRIENSAGNAVWSQYLTRSSTRTTTYIYGLKSGETYTAKLGVNEPPTYQYVSRATPVSFSTPSSPGPELEALTVGPSQLSLTWAPVAGATSYELYSGKDLNSTPIYAGPNTNFLASTAGSYFVRARTPAGLGPATYVEVYNVQKATIPGFKVQKTSATQLSLSWDPVPYQVYYRCSWVSNGAGAVVDYPKPAWSSSGVSTTVGATSATVATSNGERIYCYLLAGDSSTNWATRVSAAKAARW